MEIACDESGYEGEKLIGATTDVFAHSSVRFDVEAAAECMRELRARIRSPASEYKANVVLREKHRRVLVWLLGPEGPLRGRAHVFLIDKAHFVVGRLAELFGWSPEQALMFGRDPSESFLSAANDVLRVSANIDPLIPAIVRAVEYWGEGRPVAIVHHRQNTLSPERIAQLRSMCALSRLTFADSSTDPRVELADIVAGAVRKIASDELNGRGDPALTSLLPSYVDSHSVWDDARSWALLSAGRRG